MDLVAIGTTSLHVRIKFRDFGVNIGDPFANDEDNNNNSSDAT
jgi:hypothetical protein